MADVVIQVVVGDPLVDVVEQTAELLVSQTAVVAQAAREQRDGVADTAEAAAKLHAPWSLIQAAPKAPVTNQVPGPPSP